MSKQSDAKAAQGYRLKAYCCGDCKHFQSDMALPPSKLKVVYTGATDAQAKFGRGDDPREFLTEGAEYTVTDKEVHSWHTVLTLSEFPDRKFNSVCFTEAELLAIKFVGAAS